MWNAFLGIIVGLCVALPILIIATNNFVTGFLATFTLILITTMVIGLIPMAGWKLGVRFGTNYYRKTLYFREITCREFVDFRNFVVLKT